VSREVRRVVRDHAVEMRAVFDAEMAGGDPLPLVAARVAEKLRAVDPGLLSGWLDAGVVSFLRDAMAHIDRSGRAHARLGAARGVFGEMSDAVEGGDPGALVGWLDTVHRATPDGSRFRLRDMGRDQLLFVADCYADLARSSAFEAAFMRALAKRVGRRTVGEVYTEVQIAAMRSGITI
jgi:hypothetical protein